MMIGVNQKYKRLMLKISSHSFYYDFLEHLFSFSSKHCRIIIVYCLYMTWRDYQNKGIVRSLLRFLIDNQSRPPFHFQTFSRGVVYTWREDIIRTVAITIRQVIRFKKGKKVFILKLKLQLSQNSIIHC